MNDRSRKVLDEPIGGQEAGADGEYLVGTVSYSIRRGYYLHVYYCKRERWEHGTSESFALFSSGKQVLLELAPRFNAKKLDAVAHNLTHASAGTLADLKAEVLALRQSNLAKAQTRREHFAEGQ